MDACVRPLTVTDEDIYLHGVELGGLLHVLGAAGAAAAGDAVDEAEELVLDLSSEVGHGTRSLGELCC
jgi:hypothetical protein